MTDEDGDRDSPTYQSERFKDSGDPPTHESRVGTVLLNATDANVADVIEATVAGKATDPLPNLWLTANNAPNPANFSAFYVQSDDDSVKQTSFSSPSFFTSSLIVGSDTRVLKMFAPRLNTSLRCEQIASDDFPPFTTISRTLQYAIEFFEI